MENILHLLRSLPLLENYDNDVDLWIQDFTRKTELWDISEPRKIFILIKECVNEEIKYVVEKLKEEKNANEYPTLNEIKCVIEKHLGINSNKKCEELWKLCIKQNETIKEFNLKFMRKYRNIDLEYRKFITVKNYVNSIKPRFYPCLRVLEENCKTLEEATKISERACEIEEILGDKVEKYYKTIFNMENTNSSVCNQHKCNKSKLTEITERKNNNKEIMCFKCYELGHKVFDCKYTYRELAIMEEQGILDDNKRKHFISPENKLITKQSNNVIKCSNNYKNYKLNYKSNDLRNKEYKREDNVKVRNYDKNNGINNYYKINNGNKNRTVNQNKVFNDKSNIKERKINDNYEINYENKISLNKNIKGNRNISSIYIVKNKSGNEIELNSQNSVDILENKVEKENKLNSYEIDSQSSLRTVGSKEEELMSDTTIVSKDNYMNNQNSVKEKVKTINDKMEFSVKNSNDALIDKIKAIIANYEKKKRKAEF